MMERPVLMMGRSISSEQWPIPAGRVEDKMSSYLKLMANIVEEQMCQLDIWILFHDAVDIFRI